VDSNLSGDRCAPILLDSNLSEIGGFSPWWTQGVNSPPRNHQGAYPPSSLSMPGLPEARSSLCVRSCLRASDCTRAAVPRSLSSLIRFLWGQSSHEACLRDGCARCDANLQTYLPACKHTVDSSILACTRPAGRVCLILWNEGGQRLCSMVNGVPCAGGAFAGGVEGCAVLMCQKPLLVTLLNIIIHLTEHYHPPH